MEDQKITRIFNLMGKESMAFSNGNLRWIPGPQTPDCLKYEGGQAGGGGDLPPRYANAASIVRDSTIVPNLHDPILGFTYTSSKGFFMDCSLRVEMAHPNSIENHIETFLMVRKQRRYSETVEKP